MKRSILVIALLCAGIVQAQTFFYTSQTNDYNTIVTVDLSTGSVEDSYACVPDEIIGLPIYHDMAADIEGNLYFVTAGGYMYRMDADSPGTCNYMDIYLDYVVNGLVADGGHYLYAGAGDKIFRIDTDTNEVLDMGMLPEWTYSAGDLFFYEERLFLTAFDNQNEKFLLEINMPNPSESCIFMEMTGIDSWGAFSYESGNGTEVYLFSLNPDGMTTALLPLDMENKIIGEPVYQMDVIALGSAAPYSNTSDDSACHSLGLPGLSNAEFDFNIVNPAHNELIISTTLNKNGLTGTLYDVSGRLIKILDLSTSYVDISGIAQGSYLLTVNAPEGKRFTRKIVIK